MWAAAVKNTAHLRQMICMIYSNFTISAFQGRFIPDLYDVYDVYDLYDLYDVYDLYDLAHVAGREPYHLHDLAHFSWVGSTQILHIS